jgi:transcriptional regulator with XRE-family HTH domain
MTTFGERVKHERERRRYSQNKLAKLVGISQALLSKIEAGKSPAPGGEVVKRLAQILWVTTDLLLGMDDDSERAPNAMTLVGAEA